MELTQEQVALISAAKEDGYECAQVVATGDAYTIGEIVRWRGHCTGLVTVIRLQPSSAYFVGREDTMTGECFNRHFRKV